MIESGINFFGLFFFLKWNVFFIECWKLLKKLEDIIYKVMLIIKKKSEMIKKVFDNEEVVIGFLFINK